MDEEYRQRWQDLFIGDFTGDEETLQEIKKTYEDKKYLLDTHTGVGVQVYRNYAQRTGDQTKTIIDATANPYKFNQAVLEAIAGKEAVTRTSFPFFRNCTITGMPIHRALKTWIKDRLFIIGSLKNPVLSRPFGIF